MPKINFSIVHIAKKKYKRPYCYVFSEKSKRQKNKGHFYSGHPLKCLRACLVSDSKQQFSEFKHQKLWSPKKKKNMFGKSVYFGVFSHNSQFRVFKHCIRTHPYQFLVFK